MKKQRRNHSQEFKREAVALVVEHGYSCAAAGRSLGVSGALIGRWKQDLADNRRGGVSREGQAYSRAAAYS